MTFNGSAMTSTESEVMIENAVMNVLSCSRQVAYGQREHSQTDK